MITTIFFDYDGVLCHDRFFASKLIPDNQELYDWIQTNLFSQNDNIDKWLRGKISFKDINKIIANSSGLDHEYLNNILLESVKDMTLDQKILNLVKTLRESGYNLALVTDNMDVFNLVTIPDKKLDQYFDVIINSCDYGHVKSDPGGPLFKIALEAVPERNFSNFLLIDDSRVSIKEFKKLGGKAILYESHLKLNDDLQKQLNN